MRPEDYYMSGLPVFYWFYPLFLFPSSLLSVIDQWFICTWSPSHWCLQFTLHERDKRCDTFLFLIKHIYWGQLCAYHQPELWHQLLLLMVLHLKKNIWLLNKSTALIRCNYSNNNNKNPTGKQTQVFSFVCSAHSCSTWRNSSKCEVLHPGLTCCLQNLI